MVAYFSSGIVGLLLQETLADTDVCVIYLVPYFGVRV